MGLFLSGRTVYHHPKRMYRIITIAISILFVGLASTAQVRTLRIDPDMPVGADAGVCVLQLDVTGSADIILEGDRINFRLRAGAVPEDTGSSCSAAIPREPLDSFRLDRVKGKGRVLLVENPADRNQFQAWIRIDSDSTSPEHYEMRVAWRANDTAVTDGQDELKLTARGRPRRWVPQGIRASAASLEGTPLSSYDNDPLRFDTSSTGQLEFRGQVDDTVEFLVRADNLHTIQLAGQPVKVERFRFTQPLPSRGQISISVEKKDGRGTVELVQSPSRDNAFTARIRVSDPQGGSDRYHWILTWRKEGDDR